MPDITPPGTLNIAQNDGLGPSLRAVITAAGMTLTVEDQLEDEESSYGSITLGKAEARDLGRHLLAWAGEP